jgi:hypothetical protein
MYRNVLGEKVSKRRYREMLAAARNRRELIAAGLGRRELLKMGLLSSAGMLAAIKGLSARAGTPQGPANLCAPGNRQPVRPPGHSAGLCRFCRSHSPSLPSIRHRPSRPTLPLEKRVPARIRP